MSSALDAFAPPFAAAALADGRVAVIDAVGYRVKVLNGVAVDFENRIWVSRTAADGLSGGPTDVFTADGDYLGTLSEDAFRLPDAFGPSGLMAYVEADDLDVPTVRVVRLRGLEPAVP